MKKVIGLDIGHCDTSAACPEMQIDGSYLVKRLVILDKEQVISTQVILTNEQMQQLSGHLRPDVKFLSSLGEFKIAKRLSDNISDGERFFYFKTDPKQFDEPCGISEIAKDCKITHGMVMACFVFAVLEKILKSNDTTCEWAREEIELLVGCPATEKWVSDDAKKTYTELIRTATGVGNVTIIPESRAAMFSSIESKNTRISAMNGAAVFDFGSSTADYTYMLLGKRIMEFSWDLGASLIERQMVMEAYEQAIEEFGMFTATPESFAKNEDGLRSVKESWYNGEYGEEGEALCRFISASEQNRPELLKKIFKVVSINEKTMLNVTGNRPVSVVCNTNMIREGSFRSLCREFFEAAKEQLEEEELPLESVVLTGGASKMDFIYDICKSVFPDTSIYIERNPSHTVSNGLGWVSVSDDNIESCIEAARKVVNANPECQMKPLKEELADGLFDLICKITEESVSEWAEANGDELTLRDLQKSIEEKMESEQTKKWVEDFCILSINRWKARLSNQLEMAINEQVEKLYSENVAKSLMISKDVWSELQAKEMPVDRLNVAALVNHINMDSLMRKLAKMIIVVVSTILGALAGGGIFSGVTGIIGWMVGEVLSEFISDEDLDRPREQSLRKRTVDKVRKKVRAERKELLKDFEAGFDVFAEKYSEMLENTLRSAFEIVTLRKFDI